MLLPRPTAPLDPLADGSQEADSRWGRGGKGLRGEEEGGNIATVGSSG